MALRTSFQPVKYEKQTKPRDISQRTALFLAAAAGLLGLWIRAGIPLIAVPDAIFDDAFFVRTAHYLLAGQWLGPYDKMTLAKGMFYPLFIAGASLLAIPLKIAEHLAYLAASCIAAVVAWRASGRRWLAVVVFAGLALNPVMWHNWMDRVSRETLYSAESLALFALVVLVSFPELRRSQKNIRLGLICGSVWAAFWLTREESILLLPACAIVVGIGGVNFWLLSKRDKGKPDNGARQVSGLHSIVVPMSVSLAVFLLGVGTVAAINWHYYGVFRTNEYRSGEFVRAYGAFTRIQPTEFHRYVPAPADDRQKAYEVSPEAKRLATSLDGQHGHDWAALGCSIHPIPPPCDLQSGWFMWALRDAMAETGHYRSAPETEAYYAAVANEIDSACDSGRIRCSAQRNSFTPPFRWEYVGETVEAAKVIGKLVFDMGGGEVGAVPSPGTANGQADFADLTGERISPPVGGVTQNVSLGRVDGWVAARGDEPTLQVVARTNREVKNMIHTVPAPDVVAVYPDLKASRFALISDCPVMDCDLTIHSSTDSVSVPFYRLLTKGAPIATPNLILFMDVQAGAANTWVSDRRRAFQTRNAHRLGLIYAKSSRPLAVFATIGLLVAIVRFGVRRPSLPMLAIAVGSMVAVASRIFALSYIAATSFTTNFLHYCSPATPFLIVFVITGLYLGCSSLIGSNSVASSHTMNPPANT